MGTLFRFIAALFFLLCVCDLHAQQQNIRLGLFGFAYGRVNLNYERTFSENKSLNVQVGIQTPNPRPLLGAIALLDNTGAFTITRGKHAVGIGILTDLRLYPKAKTIGQTGFYFAPFLAGNYNRFILDGEYRDLATNTSTPDLYRVNMYNLSTGVKLGIRWNIDEHLVIDFNYFGFGMGVTFVNADYQSSDEMPDYQQLSEDLEWEIYLDGTYLGDYETEPTPDLIKITGSFLAPVFKFSCSIGYRF